LIKSVSECWPLLIRDGGVSAKLAAIEAGREATLYLNVLPDISEAASPVPNEALVEFRAQALPVDMTVPPPNLSISVSGNGDRLTGTFWFRSDVVSPESVSALRHSFDKVISAVLSNLDAPLLDL
jgi:hypothetical protein